MVVNKSDQLSVAHKNEGNKLFLNENYFKALEEYNKVKYENSSIFRIGSKFPNLIF